MWWWRRCRWRCWRRLGLRPGGRRRCCGAKLGMDSVARILIIVYPWRREGKSGNTRRAMRREYDFSKGTRGAVLRVPPKKTRVTIRLDNDILDWFRQQVDDAGGGNYQTLINDALRAFVHRKQEGLEATLRRVIRDELRRAG